MSVRRDTRAKESIPLDALAERLPALLADVQRTLFESARAFRDDNTTPAASVAEVDASLRRGAARASSRCRGTTRGVRGGDQGADGATLRCVPLDQSPLPRHETRAGQPVALFARAYSETP